MAWNIKLRKSSLRKTTGKWDACKKGKIRKLRGQSRKRK